MTTAPADLLSGLNAAQRAAVTFGDGPLLILAGPGSGKTRVLAHRIAYLVRERGVAPWRLLAVTFTNKAAREMRDRVAALVGGEVEGMTLGTFHALCARILRRDGAALGIDRSFAIYDDADQLGVVRRAVTDLGISPKQFNPRALLGAISRAKSEGIDPAAYQAGARNYLDEIISRVYQTYAATLRANQALDFDDLLLRTLHLFRDVPEVRQRYQDRYRHVLVDEFQDTNLTQYQLARAWAGGTGNLVVVGDPDQSIYSWRAADIRNILHFERDYPDACVVRLEQNYRSTQAIVRVADAVIQPAAERIHKRLWTENPAGQRPVVFEGYTEAEEAQFVVDEVQRHVGAGEWRPGNVAVLYRTNAQSRVLEERCLLAGLRYRLVGGTRFYQRREVKDLLAYLRLVQNPADTVAFERVVNVPARGIGDRTRAVLLEWAQARGGGPLDAIAALGQPEGPRVTARALAPLLGFRQLVEGARRIAEAGTVDAVLGQLLTETQYQDHLFREGESGSESAEERWQNVLELRTVARNYDALAPDAALSAFLEDVALVSDVDQLEDGAPDAVTLITLHAAKGLEFPVVFLLGLEEGVLPHIRSFDDPHALEEERRLCYVGITRARERLYLGRAFRRALAGSAGHNPPSRFLADIPDDAVEHHGRAASGPGRPRDRWSEWDEAAGDSPVGSVDVGPLPRLHLAEGDRVRHRVFGEGLVVACRDAGRDQEVTVDFARAGVKRLLLSYAPLEKV